METGRLDKREVALFALTVFLSAYLLFQVQPLISKFILPWFGGSPTVWTTAMLFFQSVLFGGYVYAHLITRHGSPRVQAGVHVTLLAAAAMLAVFVIPDASLKPTGDDSPIGQILLLLGLSVGLPYFCLATTGPLIQYWYARSGTGGSVFRLYALSNVGSFLALLSFPYVFEPLFELPQLGRFWTWGFWIFALLCAAVALRVPRMGQAPVARSMATDIDTTDLFAQPTLIQRMRWIALPALASLAFIATTDHVSHNIAPEPRLWIAALALYLLTFIICFDHPRWYRRAWIASIGLIAILFVAGRKEIPGWFGLDWDYGVAEMRWIHLTAMFLVCLMSHGELYRQRPGNPRYLTEFYLWMSFGGACGGLFVALVATNWFADYYEWPLFLIASIGLASFILASAWGKSGVGARGAAGLACLVLGGMTLYWEDPLNWRRDANADYTDIYLHQSRNFYGTVSVKERRFFQEPSQGYRVFYSGSVTHGVQYLDPARHRLPVSYYSEGSGVGETLIYAQARQASLRVAIIGLGAGTLATYARAADEYDFYEINPEAVRVASRWFDNVPSCRARSKQVIVGDARLKLQQLADDVRYDVIVLDAFTGGSVPIHLLTREAFRIYQRHLKPDGFIAVHITNGYLNLYPVVRRQAEALGMGFRNKYLPGDADRQIRHNQYFIITNDRQYLHRYPSVNRKYFDDNGVLIREEDPNLPGVPLWTDHFSSLNPIELRD
ncbi:MAG TPA: fused MFS/spermidine synthase [Rhodocyclaceae bacterium]|nr:fused MFS/spermidine synthase [Rhodocyclaceae bacterium]